MKSLIHRLLLVSILILSPVLLSSTSKNVDAYNIALQYYKDLAYLINYYAYDKNQSYTKKNNFGFTVIKEYSRSIKIYAENREELNILEMPPAERDRFFKQWIVSEATKMNEKFKLDHRGNWIKQIKRINRSFKRSFRYRTQKGLIDSLGDDPLARIMLDLEPKESKSYSKSLQSDLWGQTFDHYNDQYTQKSGAPTSSSSQDFIDSIRDSIQKGRILVALPDGDYTKLPGVLFRGSNLYDVGHVAIIKLNADDVPEIISDTLSLTIGTDASKDMHHESLWHDWTKVHGRAYLLQIFKEKWLRKNEGYQLVTTDVDGDSLHTEALNHMDSKYCKFFQIFKAKPFAPNRFICSSAAWYYAKNTKEVELGIPYKRSIWPADILKSNFTRVVGKTW